ncbi:MAG: OsmC family peroxiredoxin [Candidatus Thorarchaeota archaeon]|nr:MAG: OsmC family peroxiredoxin [Candidatus Thorarchaeota archaeon]RLI59871.1 MAG: OsmC family peroxiredoxin [Candidatus Thorarchaeota archaeon]
MEIPIRKLFPRTQNGFVGVALSEDTQTYNVRVDWTRDRVGKLLIDGKPTVEVATPPEFSGPEGIISPEDLFVASAAVCLMTTFVTFTKKMRFEYKGFTVNGTGTLQKLEKGYQFTKIVLNATVTVESEELRPKAQRALELAGKYCLVTNSMKCETEHINNVVVE